MSNTNERPDAYKESVTDLQEAEKLGQGYILYRDLGESNAEVTVHDCDAKDIAYLICELAKLSPVALFLAIKNLPGIGGNEKDAA